MADFVAMLRDEVERRVGPQKFKVWFKNSTHFTMVDDHLRIGVPNQFIGTWIENHFADIIRQACEGLGKPGVQVHFAIDPKLFGRQPASQLDTQARTVAKTRSSKPKKLPAICSGFDSSSEHQLRYGLDDFIVGPNSQLAYAAVQDVIRSVGAAYNPLYVYSACGLGKTHLIQGLCSELQKQGKKAWAYVTGEQFTNDFVYAVRTRQTQAFREWYRHLDVLVIDDVHFLANKRATQDELQHTFDAIEAMGKQIVMASDTQPKLLGQLSPSLVNRFISGMVVKIEAPDLVTRMSILRRKAATFSQPVPEQVIHYIAELFVGNIRELEGAMLKLAAFSRLVGQPLTLNLARSALEEYARKVQPAVRISDIEGRVCSYFGLTAADLHSTIKTRTVALARNVAMYLTRRQTAMSFPEIAKHMGGKNHATVLLACRKIERMLTGQEPAKWLSAAGPIERPISEVIDAIVSEGPGGSAATMTSSGSLPLISTRPSTPVGTTVVPPPADIQPPAAPTSSALANKRPSKREIVVHTADRSRIVDLDELARLDRLDRSGPLDEHEALRNAE